MTKIAMFLMSKFQLREVEVFTSRRLKILQNYTSHHFVCPDILNVPRFRKTGKQIGRLFNLIGKDYWSVKALCSLSYYTTIHSQDYRREPGERSPGMDV